MVLQPALEDKNKLKSERIWKARFTETEEGGKTADFVNVLDSPKEKEYLPVSSENKS